MAVDIQGLVPDMLAAAAGVLRQKWPEARAFAQSEFTKYAEAVRLVGELYAAGEITQARAKLHLRFQKAAMANVLLTIEGLGVIAVEQAISAAVGVVRDVVNTAVGFRLV